MLPVGVLIPTRNSMRFLPCHVEAMRHWLDLAQEIIGISVVHNSRPYFYAYLGGQALKLILAVLIFLDLTRLALADHPALLLRERGWGRPDDANQNSGMEPD